MPSHKDDGWITKNNGFNQVPVLFSIAHPLFSPALRSKSTMASVIGTPVKYSSQ
jgi:hypothetical protein